jgi:hypothetical protein
VAVLGVDYSWTRPEPACLASKGVRFAVRYSQPDDRPKSMSPSECQQLLNAGIWLVTVHQPSGNKGWMLEGFNRGVKAAKDALAVARDECGMDEGRPVYFALDIDPNVLTVPQRDEARSLMAAELMGVHRHSSADADERADRLLAEALEGADDLSAPRLAFERVLSVSQWDAVRQCLRGAGSVLGGVAEVGIYGGYLAIERCTPQYAAWGWQTFAWSAGRWHARAQLQQYHNNQGVCGGTIDWDRAVADDFGQWDDP